MVHGKHIIRNCQNILKIPVVYSFWITTKYMKIVSTVKNGYDSGKFWIRQLKVKSCIKVSYLMDKKTFWISDS